MFPYMSSYMYLLDRYRRNRPRTPWDENPGMGTGDAGDVFGRPDAMDSTGAPDSTGAGLHRGADAFDRPDRRRGVGSALLAFGANVLEGAGRGDWGSLGRGVAAGAEAYGATQDRARQESRQASDDARRQAAEERQARLADAQITNYEEDNRRARDAAEAKTKAEQTEVERQHAAVARLTPEQQARLGPLVGTDDFYRSYWEITKPPDTEKPYRTQVGRSLVEVGPDDKTRVLYTAPPDPPTSNANRPPLTRLFPDGTIKQWDYDRKVWFTIASGPTAEQLHDDIAAEADKRYNAWIQGRMKGVGEPLPIDELQTWQKQHPGQRTIPTKKSPSEHTVRVKMRDGSMRTMTEDEYMRWKFRIEAQMEVQRRHRAALQQQNNITLYMDQSGGFHQ